MEYGEEIDWNDDVFKLFPEYGVNAKKEEEELDSDGNPK